jgi:hypothetical protein
MSNTSSKSLSLAEIRALRDLYNDPVPQMNPIFMNTLFAGLDDIISKLENSDRAISLLRRCYTEMTQSAEDSRPIPESCHELILVRDFLNL